METKVNVFKTALEVCSDSPATPVLDRIDINAFFREYDVFYLKREKKTKIDSITPAIEYDENIVSVKSISPLQYFILARKSKHTQTSIVKIVKETGDEDAAVEVRNGIKSVFSVESFFRIIGRDKKEEYFAFVIVSLLLNSLPMTDEVEESVCRNTMGRLFLKVKDSGKKSNEIVAADISIDPYFNFHVKATTFSRVSAFRKDKEQALSKAKKEGKPGLKEWADKWLEKLKTEPRYRLFDNAATDSQVLNKKLNVEDESAVFVKHPIKENSKNRINYLSIISGARTSSEDFDKCKAGIYFSIIEKFNKYFGHIVKLRFKTVEATQLRPKSAIGKRSGFVDKPSCGFDEVLENCYLTRRNWKVYLLFDDTLYDAEKAEIKNHPNYHLLKEKLKLTSNEQNPTELIECDSIDDAFDEKSIDIIHIIHDSDWYRVNKTKDPHNREWRKNVNVQHITFENLTNKDKKGSKREEANKSLVNVSIKELLIGRDLSDKTISFVDWQRLMGSSYPNKGENEHWTFGIIAKEKIKNGNKTETKIYKYFIKVYKDAKIECFRESTNDDIKHIKDNEICELIKQYDYYIETDGFKNKDNVKIIQDPSGNTALLIDNTNTLLPPFSEKDAEQFRSLLYKRTIKDEDGKETKEKDSEELKKFQKSIRSTFSHLLYWNAVVPGYLDDKELCFYCVGKQSYINSSSLDRSGRIKLIYNITEDVDTDFLLKEMLPLFGVTYVVKDGEYSAYPFPFKYINEYSKRWQEYTDDEEVEIKKK